MVRYRVLIVVSLMSVLLSSWSGKKCNCDVFYSPENRVFFSDSVWSNDIHLSLDKYDSIYTNIGLKSSGIVPIDSSNYYEKKGVRDYLYVIDGDTILFNNYNGKMKFGSTSFNNPNTIVKVGDLELYGSTKLSRLLDINCEFKCLSVLTKIGDNTQLRIVKQSSTSYLLFNKKNNLISFSVIEK